MHFSAVNCGNNSKGKMMRSKIDTVFESLSDIPKTL